MANITAVAKLESKELLIDGQYTLQFRADYDHDANKEWSKFTPMLNLSMVVVESVAQQLVQGGSYLITFEKRENDQS